MLNRIWIIQLISADLFENWSMIQTYSHIELFIWSVLHFQCNIDLFFANTNLSSISSIRHIVWNILFYDNSLLRPYSIKFVAVYEVMSSKSHKLTRNIFEWLRWTSQISFSGLYKNHRRKTIDLNWQQKSLINCFIDSLKRNTKITVKIRCLFQKWCIY